MLQYEQRCRETETVRINDVLLYPLDSCSTIKCLKYEAKIHQAFWIFAAMQIYFNLAPFQFFVGRNSGGRPWTKLNNVEVRVWSWKPLWFVCYCSVPYQQITYTSTWVVHLHPIHSAFSPTLRLPQPACDKIWSPAKQKYAYKCLFSK